MKSCNSVILQSGKNVINPFLTSFQRFLMRNVSMDFPNYATLKYKHIEVFQGPNHITCLFV